MRPTGMTISRRDNTTSMYSVVFENARGQVSIEVSPGQLLRWAGEMLDRIQRDEASRSRIPRDSPHHPGPGAA